MAESSSQSKEVVGDDKPIPGIRRVVTDQGNKAQRLLRVDQIYSRKDRQTHFVKTTKTIAKPDRFGKTALVVRRIISSKGMVSDIEVDIKSPHLERFMKEIFDGVSGLKLNKTPPIASLELFFWAAPELLRIKEDEKQKEKPDQSLINDIGTALRLVDEDWGDQITNMRSLLAQDEITYDLLWAIFPPKEMCIATNHGLLKQTQALQLNSSDYGQRENGAHYFWAEGYVITHDGEDFGRGSFTVEIDRFEGASKLTNLSVYPFRYHPEEELVKQQLIARGKTYISLLEAPACREYPAQYGMHENTMADKSERISVKGRVMVDPEGYRQHNSSSGLNTPYVYSENLMSTEGLNDLQYLICAYWINGFSFPRKIWCQMAVADLKTVVWNQHAFEKLVIDEGRRELIHALVKSHRNDEATFDDIIQNKGQGLVGLLSGSPGVGKTLTAEAVAEVTQRPLYMVSAGELGIEADSLDNRLNMVLDITRRWGCVLLMDEADVFLAARANDLQRDSLVSIFLRRLEYFQGICILTTNRKSEIDPAFQSRIHFTIHYQDLDEVSRKAVWKNFISTIANATEEAGFSEEVIARLSTYVLNGRQIKNIVSCAVSLAREKNTPITATQIENLIDILVD